MTDCGRNAMVADGMSKSWVMNSAGREQGRESMPALWKVKPVSLDHRKEGSQWRIGEAESRNLVEGAAL